MAKKSTTNAGGNATAEKPAPKPMKNKAEGLKVLSTIEISPKKLIFTDKFRGRSAPVSMEDRIARADSIRQEGQLQPIQVRQVSGTDTYEVIFGNTRGLAGELLCDGYTTNEGREVEGKPDFKLRAEVVDITDEEAFIRNVVENSQRTQTSPIDDALNQKMLRENFQLSDVSIARLYGYKSSATCTRLKKLLELDEDLQGKIHEGTMTLQAGVELVTVPAEDRTAVWLKAVDATGKGDDTKVGAAIIQAAIKALKKERAETNGTTGGGTGGEGGSNQIDKGDGNQPTGGGSDGTGFTGNEGGTGGGSDAAPGKQLTVKQIKNELADIAGNNECPEKVAELCNVLLGFIDGKSDTGDLAKWMAANVQGPVTA